MEKIPQKQADEILFADQAFDETSFNFLGNYVGKDMVQTLPNLKQYHAIVAGKAVKSNMPMIVDLTREKNDPGPGT